MHEGEAVTQWDHVSCKYVYRHSNNIKIVGALNHVICFSRNNGYFTNYPTLIYTHIYIYNILFFIYFFSYKPIFRSEILYGSLSKTCIRFGLKYLPVLYFSYRIKKRNKICKASTKIWPAYLVFHKNGLLLGNPNAPHAFFLKSQLAEMFIPPIISSAIDFQSIKWRSLIFFGKQLHLVSLFFLPMTQTNSSLAIWAKSKCVNQCKSGLPSPLTWSIGQVK